MAMVMESLAAAFSFPSPVDSAVPVFFSLCSLVPPDADVCKSLFPSVLPLHPARAPVAIDIHSSSAKTFFFIFISSSFVMVTQLHDRHGADDRLPNALAPLPQGPVLSDGIPLWHKYSEMQNGSRVWDLWGMSILP